MTNDRYDAAIRVINAMTDTQTQLVNLLHTYQDDDETDEPRGCSTPIPCPDFETFHIRGLTVDPDEWTPDPADMNKIREAVHDGWPAHTWQKTALRTPQVETPDPEPYIPDFNTACVPDWWLTTTPEAPDDNTPTPNVNAGYQQTGWCNPSDELTKLLTYDPNWKPDPNIDYDTLDDEDDYDHCSTCGRSDRPDPTPETDHTLRAPKWANTQGTEPGYTLIPDPYGSGANDGTWTNYQLTHRPTFWERRRRCIIAATLGGTAALCMITMAYGYWRT